jgi:hypothetical protein
MPSQFSQISWVRVVLTALIVHIASFFIVMSIISGFATYLGLQDYDFPDQDIVNLFADQYAPIMGQVCLVVFTFFGARNTAKNVENAPLDNGLVVGILVGIVYLIFRGGTPINFGVLITAALIVGMGWLGARSMGKK